MIPGMSTSLSSQQLQATLSAASSASEHATVLPHHPITCASKLYFEEDGTFRCEHAEAPPMDVRTNQCVTHSVALLILELAMQL